LQQAKVRDVKSDDEAADVRPSPDRLVFSVASASFPMQEHRRRKIPTPAASAPNSGDKTKRQKVLYGENEPTTSRVDDDDADKTAEKPQRMTRGRVKDDDNTDADEPPAKRTQISDTYNVTVTLTNTYTHTYAHARTHASTHTHARARAHTHILTHSLAHTHTYSHTHAHTRTRSISHSATHAHTLLYCATEY
jgi:hypothetical protein